jgi:hypothetical protein
MGRTSIPAVMHELASPGTAEGKVAALRSLKNEIVGHEQRKELVVASGVVQPLARLLGQENGRESNSRNGWEDGTVDEREGGGHDEGRDDWNEVRLQATLVVGSLANGEHAAWRRQSEG